MDVGDRKQVAASRFDRRVAGKAASASGQNDGEDVKAVKEEVLEQLDKEVSGLRLENRRLREEINDLNRRLDEKDQALETYKSLVDKLTQQYKQYKIASEVKEQDIKRCEEHIVLLEGTLQTERAEHIRYLTRQHEHRNDPGSQVQKADGRGGQGGGGEGGGLTNNIGGMQLDATQGYRVHNSASRAGDPQDTDMIDSYDVPHM